MPRSSSVFALVLVGAAASWLAGCGGEAAGGGGGSGCVTTGQGGSGDGGSGEGGSGGSGGGGGGGGLLSCEDSVFDYPGVAACVAKEGGGLDPGNTGSDLDVTGTVTDVAEDAPASCFFDTPWRVGTPGPQPSFLRIEDGEGGAYWIGLSVPGLVAPSVGTVVSLSVLREPSYLTPTSRVFEISTDSALVAYVAQAAAPAVDLPGELTYGSAGQLCASREGCCMFSHEQLAISGVAVEPGGTVDVDGFRIVDGGFLNWAQIDGCCDAGPTATLAVLPVPAVD